MESASAVELRGQREPAPSLVALVRGAWVGLGAARAAESALLGASAALLLAAAGVSAGLELARADLWAAALTGAALAASAWWLEHRTAPLEVARALDRRLLHEGALFTAYELELKRAGGPLARLLQARVLATLKRRDALRAVLPPLALALVAPIAAGAVLAFALETARAEPERPALAELARGLVAGLESARAAAELAGEGEELEIAPALQAAALEARGLERELERLRHASPETALRRIEALDRSLVALEAELAALATPAADEIEARLAAARSWLDALRQPLRELAPPEASAGAPPAGERAGDDPNAAGDLPGVTAEGEDGRMSRSTSPGDGAEAPADPEQPGASASPPPAPGAVEGGSSAGAWWPAEYDEVVRRWLERTRTGGV